MSANRFILLIAFVTMTAAQTPLANLPSEKFTCKNGDSFTGPVVGKSTATLTIKVLRLTLMGKNILSHSTADGGLTLVHKDGTVFSGKFLKTSTGDFQLNEPLYPENFDLLRADIAKRESTVLPEAIKQEGKPTAHVYTAVGVGATVSQIRTLLPNLLSIHLGFNHDLSFLHRNQAWYVPWIFTEVGIHYTNHNPYLLIGGSLVLGPEWRFHVTAAQHAFVQIGGGMNFLRVRDNIFDQPHVGFHGHSKLGYGFRFAEWILFGAVSISYIHDPTAPLTSLGGQIGVGRSLGDKN